MDIRHTKDYHGWHSPSSSLCFLYPSSLALPTTWSPLLSLSLPYPGSFLPRFLLPLTGGRYIVVGKGSQSWCEVPASLLHSVFVLSLSGSPKVLQVLMQPDRGRNGAGVGGGNRRGRCEPVSLFLENECNFHSFPWKLSPAVECLTAGCRGVALVSNGPGNGFALSLYLVPQR